jgi:predicted kinase
MKIKILRGGSGAGKSTWVKNNHSDAKVFSADLYFMVDGEYKFDPAKLGAAHAQCLRSFIEHIQTDAHDYERVAIVDNTNTSVSEFAPYAQTALAYGHDVEILTFVYDPIVAHARNTHGTPLKACIEMHRRIQEQTAFIPPWWKHDYVVSSSPVPVPQP